MIDHVLGMSCTVCGRVYEHAPDRYVCEDDGEVGTLDVRYDYDLVASRLDRATLTGDVDTMWRFRPLMPIAAGAAVPPLTVGGTPLYNTSALTTRLGLAATWVKDEGRQPTGSLKDRASAVALVKAAEAAADVVTTASTGNAAAALSGLAASVGQPAVIFVPKSAPEAKVAQLLAYGATVVLVEGSYNDAFELCTQAADHYGWYNRNTGVNPFTTEGKKTVSLEILAQLRWDPPDVILVSVGDGSIIGGVHKGLRDAMALGWITRMPRLIGVQAAGSDFMVQAFESGEDVRTKEPIVARTVADSISADLPRDRVKAMNAVTETSGAFIRVTDDEILAAIPELARATGVFAEPAGSAAYAGLVSAQRSGLVESGDSAVVIATGNGLKDVGAAMRGCSRVRRISDHRCADSRCPDCSARTPSESQERTWMIDLTVNQARLDSAVSTARDRSIQIPTFAQMYDPSLIPAGVKTALKDVGLWDIDPLNLFRISWHNEPTAHGGGYGTVNYIELPPELTGVDARIVQLIGKWFPTGAHKVGAAFGCLVPRLVTGQFDPATQKAVWPSTGNYCRGGAYDSALLGCASIAILPEGMSQERFEWLETVAGEVIKTPGSESNVKEIFDKCNELRASGEDLVIFNQFDEFGNYLWHYAVTGPAMIEVIESIKGPGDRFAGVALTTGSAGTIAAGDRLKQDYPTSLIAAGEAVQCPTILYNGFGDHRIEGIGDKHIPWVHNVRNTDMAIGLDDQATVDLIRLFNEPAGREYLVAQGVKPDIVEQLHLLGISGVANLLSAVKMAKYYELTSHDIIITVGTDSMEMYGSRLVEMEAAHGEFTGSDAVAAFHRHLLGAGIDHTHELSYYDRKRIHNLKYFTWVEQQGKTFTEIQAQWYGTDYWTSIQAMVDPIDELIVQFNESVEAGRP